MQGVPVAFSSRRAQLPAARIEIATTLEILEGFDGLPSLKRLQAHLNLDPENAPISRRGWKEANRDLLAADPAITASTLILDTPTVPHDWFPSH